MNLCVPTCYPGIVRVQGEQYPPSEKKWKSVSLEGGKVCFSRPLHMLTQQARATCSQQEELHDPSILPSLRRPNPKRWCLALAGIGCSGARPMVSANTDYNRAKALFGRVYRMPATHAWGVGPKPGVWEWADRFVDLLLPGFKEGHRAMSVEEWIDSMPSNRRAPLRRANQTLERTGWKVGYGKFTAFVKTELLPGFSKDRHGLVPMREMLDRLIQGPHDAAHCIAGKWLKPMVQKLKKYWTSDSPIFYGSTSPEHLHKWLNDTLLANSGWYFWCDFSMFDNTHSEPSWAFMERLYGAAKSDPLFRKVLRAWLRPHGRIGPFTYWARVMNASGRDDTALANGVLNGFATYCSVAAAWLNVPLQSLTPELLTRAMSHIKLSVTGDDSLGRVPEMSDEQAACFRERVNANIAQFGFEAKFMMSRNLYDAVYLGMRPYPVHVDGRVRWFWGKTIGRSTYKMGWVTLDKQRDLMAHITGIADMHRLCSSHVPVLSDLAEKILELRQGMKRTPVRRDPNREWEWPYQSNAKYSAETLQAVADMYSKRAVPGIDMEPHDVVVTVSDVQELIDTIRGIRRLPCVVDHWLWRHMVWCDDL